MFIKNKKYYTGTVYEFNLPTGHTCPHAKECVVKVDRDSGKFTNEYNTFRCYAASAERFPSARKSRWDNYDMILAGIKPILPTDAQAIRIHASGDFFNQDYFDMWLEIAERNTKVEFWAYTKSLPYWVERKDDIPSNLTLTASRGGKFDSFIEEYGLKNTIVLNRSEVKFSHKDNGVDYITHNLSGAVMPVDYNDDLARIKGLNFCLLNNHDKNKDLPSQDNGQTQGSLF